MCGIYGWVKISDKKTVKDKLVFEQLVKLSVRRGKDANGVYLGAKNGNKSLILPTTGTKLIKTSDYKKRIAPLLGESKIVIGHARLATNGNPDIEKLNQPLIDDLLVVAHNGIVVNSSNLSKKYGVMDSDSDSVVFRDVLEKCWSGVGDLKKCLIEISSDLEGTVSAVIYDKKNNKTCLLSNNGSLYYAKTEDRIVFASERFFLKKIAKNFNKFKIYKVSPYSGIEIGENGLIAELTLKKHTKFSRPEKIDYQKNGLEKYNIDFEKIKKIRRCSKCILPETTPFIEFDRKGVCNYCRDYKKIDYAGENKLEKIIKKYRSKNGKPDCILAFSGGRDSSYGLHYLVNVLKMHPITVTFDWGMLSDLGRQNQARMLAKLGIENIVVSANIAKARNHIRKNLLAWLKKPDLGMLPLLMQGDKTTEYYVDKIKKELGVELVFFCRGNSLEKEEFKSGYCGVKNADPGGVIHHYAWVDKVKLLWYYIKNFIKNPTYINSSLWSSFLGYLVTFVVPHNYIYLWHYIKWDEKKIINTLKKKYNWKGESENGLTWRVDDGSPAFYNYTYCQLQGFTENDSFRSHQIREGKMSRSDALKIIYKENKERYQSMDWYFKTIGVDGKKVLDIIAKTKKRY